MASTLPRLPVFDAIASHDPKSPAVIHYSSGRRFSYGGLLNDVAMAKEKLRQAVGDQAMEGQRIAFLVENGYDYVGANQFTIRVGQYLIENSDPALHPRQQQHCGPFILRLPRQRNTIYSREQ